MPDGEHRPDTWKIEEDEVQKWLVRVHTLPGLTLFTPARTQTSPISDEKLTGKRITIVKSMAPGSRPASIEDDLTTTDRPTSPTTRSMEGRDPLRDQSAKGKASEEA